MGALTMNQIRIAVVGFGKTARGQQSRRFAVTKLDHG